MCDDSSSAVYERAKPTTAEQRRHPIERVSTLTSFALLDLVPIYSNEEARYSSSTEQSGPGKNMGEGSFRSGSRTAPEASAAALAVVVRRAVLLRT